MPREQALAKTLEYGKISVKEMLVQISSFLGLEFYHDQDSDLCTLSTEFFVLDVSESECVLIFVEESLNSRLSYIQLYLSRFLSKKHAFYYLLKYLVSCTRNTPPHSGCGSSTCSVGSLAKHKCICSCIFTGHYCQIFDLSAVPENFNIFTHSKMDVPLEYQLYKPGMVLQKVKLDSLYYNLARLITPEDFDKKYYDFLINPEKNFYEDGCVRVIGKSVYVDGKRSSIASLAFLRGCTLKESLGFAKALGSD